VSTSTGVERALYDIELGRHQKAKEPTMTDQNLSHIYFLLDRSGSMTSIRTETIAGFDAFIAEQRKVPAPAR
jgi:hypothetical protein